MLQVRFLSQEHKTKGRKVTQTFLPFADNQYRRFAGCKSEKGKKMSKKNKNYIYTDGKKKFKKIRTYYYIENTTLYLKRLYEIGEVLYGEEVGNYLTLDIRAIVSMPAQHAGKKPLPVLYSRPGYYIYCHKNGTVVVAPDINAINEWLGKFSYDEVSVVSIHG